MRFMVKTRSKVQVQLSVLFTIPPRSISVAVTPDSAFGCVPSVVKNSALSRTQVVAKLRRKTKKAAKHIPYDLYYHTDAEARIPTV